MKFLLPEMQPATAQITNPTWQNTSFFFFFDSFLDADSMIQDLFTAPVLWNRLGLHEMPLHDPNNPFLTKHERILLFFFSFFFCFTASPFVIFFSLPVFVFYSLLCLNCFQIGIRQRGGVVCKDGTALQ